MTLTRFALILVALVILLTLYKMGQETPDPQVPMPPPVDVTQVTTVRVK